MVMVKKKTDMVLDFWQQISGNDCLKRAIEVALAGSHSTLILLTPEIHEVVRAAIRWFHSNQPYAGQQNIFTVAYLCDCHYHNHPTITCSCSPESIRRHVDDLRRTRYQYDIIIESLRPRIMDYWLCGEPFESVAGRIAKQSSGSDLGFSDYSKKLMERAYELGCLPPRVVKVARTIANLDHQISILDSHIAEAIQYQMWSFS
jgi:hypothetical protein